MRRWKVLLMAGLLGGCVATGTKIDETRLTTLTPGITTYADCVAQFGPPTATTLHPDKSRLVSYRYVQSQANAANYIPLAGALVGGVTSETTEVHLWFDPTGRLVNYTSTSGTDKTGVGLVSGSKQR